VTNKFIPTQKDALSIDCIIALSNLLTNYFNFLVIDENTNLHFIKLVITVLNPFLSWAGLIVCYMLIRKIRGKGMKGNITFKRNLIVLFIIVSFMLQPDIIIRCLEMFR